MSSEQRLGATASVGALLGDDGPERASSCAWCRAPLKLSNAVIEIAKAWNRYQARQAEAGKPAERPLQYGELAICAGCYVKRHELLETQAIREHETTHFYIKQLKEHDSYSADSLMWLRGHGCGDLVDAELRRIEQTPEKRDAKKRRAA